MPAAGSSGIHHELINQPPLLQQMQEDTFRSGGSADVAEADEQQLLGHSALRR